ncbi:hypothetical protein [Stappia sp. MMSF_3263]|uniref:hypothetical protein n=1 Tax=Stappia sp. MMSF_3263 TaxID=3046693 RepID=UPI00273E359E|nr:hypothetical protein [Stappia sp. MMSF_3263]
MIRRFVSAFVAGCVSWTTLVPSVQAQQPLSDYEKCRVLAADPFLTGASNVGVVVDLIDSQEAIKWCERARAAAPSDPQLLYWTFRAHLSGGVATDDRLENVLKSYIRLRDINAHDFALYHMFSREKEIEEAVRRYVKKIKDRYYWCKNGYCYSQLSDDYKALFSKRRQRYYFWQYSLKGYIPAFIRTLEGCRTAVLSGAAPRNDLEAELFKLAKAGRGDVLFAFAVAFARSTKVDNAETITTRQACVRPTVAQNDIEKYILPILRAYNGKPPLMEDYSELIAAIENDGAKTGPYRQYAASLDEIGEKVKLGAELSPSNRELLSILADPAREDFYKRREIWAQALNIVALLEFYGQSATGDTQTAIEKWWEIVQEQRHYSAAALFNLLANIKLLSPEQRQYVLFEFDHNKLRYAESVAYATYLIQQPGFENTLKNPYNDRAYDTLWPYIGKEQRQGSRRAPANASEAEKLFEFLSAEIIRRDDQRTALTVAAIVGGLALFGALAGGGSDLSKPAPKHDPCAGLNGLGWINSSLGDTAAFFGCKKY